VLRIAVLYFSLFVVGDQSISAQQAVIENPKKKSTALEHSIAWTVVPVGVGGGLVLQGAKGRGADEALIAIGIGIGSCGLIFGPSTGHVYAERQKPMRGAIVRVIGAGIAGLGGLGIGVASSFGNSTPSGGVALVVVGGGLLLASVTYDIATVSRSVEQYNHQRGFSTVTLRPYYFAEDKAIGSILTVRF